ncbi:MAG TPA: efflux RND transporter periplasmic adaptor subunit [Alphaproteobacteria bacterium]|jgi:multidrug efflux system membrane fusion protein|nr:efflux RND transporter periplasmic adaptor subunit [Alphaproteobacteria bacterium]
MDTVNPSYQPGPTRPAPDRRPPGRGRVTFWFIVVAVLLAVVVGGLYGFELFRSHMMAKVFATNVPPPTEVAVVKAQSESMPRYLEGIGTLAAVHQVTVAPETGGRVVRILFESGAAVKKGDPLVQLDDGPERGDLAMYQAQVRLAQANLQRTETLARQDFATKQTVDQNKSQLDQANAGIAKTQALIAQKQVLAPFDGKLGVRQIDLGQYLNAGTAVVTLTDLDTLYANFTLPEQDRGQIDVGQSVEIRVDAFPDRVFEGKVTTIEPQIDPQTRTMKVQAALANADHALLPGMYANARVALPPLPDVVTIPETAVYNTAYGDSVYVVREDEKAADGKPALKAMQTFVTTGTHHDGKVAIPKGLAVGDQVVKTGQNRLHNGAAVTIKQEESPLKIPSKPPVD